MNFFRGDVVLVPIPFTDLTRKKVGPAVVIGFGDYPGDLLGVPMLSQLQNTDLALAGWREAGLQSMSLVMLQVGLREVVGYRYYQVRGWI